MHVTWTILINSKRIKSFGYTVLMAYYYIVISKTEKGGLPQLVYNSIKLYKSVPDLDA